MKEYIRVESRGVKEGVKSPASMSMQSIMDGLALFMIDSETFGRVQVIAHQKRMTPQDVITEALDEYLDRKEG